MNGTEIIALLTQNLTPITTVVSAVVGGIFTSIFLRRNTATKEFEKIKAGHFREVAEDLLKTGKMTHMEYYKANNFLDVAQKADKYYAKLPKRDCFDAYDFDWFIRFYEAVGNISNEEMQDLWAKILAGEISHPSSFSLRRNDILKNINKSDAELFEKICNVSIHSENQYFLPRYDKYLEDNEIRYSDIMKLSELGLLYNSGFIIYSIKLHKGSNIIVKNNSLLATCNISDNNKIFSLNQYPFTQVGYEIASLIELCANDKIFLDFISEIQKENMTIKFEVHRIISEVDKQVAYQNEDLLENYLK